MSVRGEGEEHLQVDYARLAEIAERLARTEEEAARMFERLARRGGERAEHRVALAAEAHQHMEQLNR